MVVLRRFQRAVQSNRNKNILPLVGLSNVALAETEEREEIGGQEIRYTSTQH